MLTSKWHMHRMGLVDFWYYVNEEFYFKEGHLLLRGSNGSGKSVTMQSFIPLLLDGNKSSERLDAFGTKSRKIENYLLDEHIDRDDRIGYLYLEFKREDSEVYKTIGIGLHARKGRDVDSWYFVIEDNQRIGFDISLMENKLAITKTRLKNIIGEEAFITAQKVYMERVNRALFGFESLDEYRDAIALLLQLRSPKLSNSLKPDKLNDLLSDSLQALSEEDLRPMSEAISNMDGIKDRLDALMLSNQAAKNIKQVYDEYNRFLIVDKYQKYAREYKTLQDVKQAIKTCEQKIKGYEQQRVELQKVKQSLNQEQSVLEEEKRSLASQDLENLHEEIMNLKRHIEEQGKKIQQKQQLFEHKENQYMDVRTQLDSKQNEKDTLSISCQEIVEEMDDLQEELQFVEHSFLQTALQQQDPTYDFIKTQQLLKKELNDLNRGLQSFHQYDQVNVIYKNYLEQKERLDADREQQRYEWKQVRDQYHNIVEEYKERFSIWNQKNEQLTLDSDQMLTIMDYLTGYEEDQAYFKIGELVADVAALKRDNLTSIQMEKQTTYKQLLDQIHALDEEIMYWEEIKEPTPTMSMASKQNRAYLNVQHIPYTSFYQLLEFDDTVNQVDRDRLEEALIRMNLLDALVISNTHKDIVYEEEPGGSDNYIFINREVSKLEAISLKGSDIQTLVNEVNAILSGWGVRAQQGLYIDEKGFETGLLKGSLSKKEVSIYIGKEARERLRHQQLNRLHKERTEISEFVETVKQELEQVRECLHRLQFEKNQMPQEADLHEAKRQVQDVEHRIESLDKNINQIEEQLALKTRELQEISREIQQLAQQLQISATKDIFQHRFESYTEYETLLQNLRITYRDFIKTLEMTSYLEQQVLSMQEDLDVLRYDVEQLHDQYVRDQRIMEHKEIQLKDLGFDEYKERLEFIIGRLKDIPLALQEHAATYGTIQANLENAQLALSQGQETILHQEEKTQQYHTILMEEVNLGYVLEDTPTLTQIHQFVAEDQPTRKRDNINTDVQTIFYNNRSSLQEYGLMLNTILNYPDVDDIVARIDISARYKGTKVSFAQLLTILMEAIERQKNLLVESDRNIFEDVLINTISKKIRIRIQNSYAWVERMNRYMDGMNTSSGLKLNLKWQNKKAESDDELGTKELVELLEKDARVLKSNDLQRLSQHFRTKIQNARTRMEDTNNNASFHQVMHEVMDYRTWFEFKIMSQKTGETKKELTNSAFFQFSGGEKAMSMYIPLFSAVAAKFASANDDAPLLIALDEAFAGVDEKNISNMFGLIQKFKFDFIMNSQVLWGDYATVSALAIYELFRPENAHYVTIIAYEWDGHVKRMINA